MQPLNYLHECGRREFQIDEYTRHICVLGAGLASMNSEQCRTYHASISIPPPPTTYCYPKIEMEVLISVEKEAKTSMERAAKALQAKIGTDVTTNCTHALASIEGAYQSSFCFVSIISHETQKVLGYKVISNTCATCSFHRGRENNLKLTEKMLKGWNAHKSDCIEQTYGDYENVHLESEAAIELIKQVHERGIVLIH